MADAKEPKEPSYLSEVLHFYFTPELRSVGTLLYLGVFGYFTLYYIDNVFLVFRFLLYILLGHTALSGASFLLSGLIFVISLLIPFFVSFHSIFVLHRVWSKPHWSNQAKWGITAVVIVVSLVLIVASDNISRAAAHRASMQSFIEDANLTGKI